MNLIYKTLFFSILGYSLQLLSYCEAKPVLTSFASKKDTILQRETIIINGISYTATYVFDDSHSWFYVKDESGKIVYNGTPGETIVSFKFIDFNGDGYKDITLELRGVDSGAQDLIIYDLKSKGFKLAGNCSNAEKIPKTKFYYSYEDCCMGRNWSSDLFYISNSKIINVGHIKYNDGEGICFYKLNGKKKTFIKKWRVRINGSTPITTGRHIDFDLKLYWVKYWRNFIS